MDRAGTPVRVARSRACVLCTPMTKVMDAAPPAIWRSFPVHRMDLRPVEQQRCIRACWPNCRDVPGLPSSNSAMTRSLLEASISPEWVPDPVTNGVFAASAKGHHVCFPVEVISGLSAGPIALAWRQSGCPWWALPEGL